LRDVQFSTKEYCVRRSLMIGALFPANESVSLHSKDFFPLRTPVPTLVVRDMVPSDLMFLRPANYSVSKRMAFLRSFIATFRVLRGKAVAEEVGKARRLYARYFLQRYAMAAVPFALFLLSAYLYFAN